MSLADDFLKDAGVQQQSGSLVDQFTQDLQAPPAAARRPLQAPEPLSQMEQLLSKVPAGLVNNPAVAAARNIVTRAAAPMVGGAQLIANAFPESTGVPALYNRKVNEMEAADKAAQKEQPPLVAGANEFVGGMISPAQLAIGLRAGPALTAGQRAVQGGAIGAATGAAAPVEVGESEKFWGPKAAQTVASAAGGAVMQPVLGAIGDRVMARINRANFNPANASKEADSIIGGALADAGQKIEDLPEAQLQQLRKQTVEALSNGQRLDTASALRAQDFAAENIKPTLGMVTRDPGQWAAEQNVRGVKAAGEGVQRLIAEGNQGVSQGIGQYANNASEAYVAAPRLADALRQYDAKKAGDVSAAYATARASAGKDLEVPAQGLADAYGRVLNDFGDKVPQAVRAKFEALMPPPQPLPGTAQPGIFRTLDKAVSSQPGPNILNTLESAAAELSPHGYGAPLPGRAADYAPTQFTPQLTFEGANNLRSVINDHVGSDPVTNKALGILRSALNNAQTAADAGGGPYAPAVKLASQRFSEQEAIPAIAAAVNGKVDDHFVQKQIINNPSTPQVQKLAALLKQESPDAFEETRQQIGAHLVRSAFGENASSDKLVAQESYNKALRSLGTGKLEAFFEPQEVDQLKRLGRIASYQVAPPAGAASNYSNTASTIANLLRQAGGFMPIGKGTVQHAGDKIEAAAAMKPQVPVTPNLTDEQRMALSRALTAITGATGLALPRLVGQ